MSYVIFPRPVWHLIIEHLSYNDRCSLRRTCKWMSLSKNNWLISYWIHRNDPIILNLGKGLIHVQARCGLFVSSSKYRNKLSKNITIGGNFESFLNYTAEYRCLVRFATALKHGFSKIIEYGLENEGIFTWQSTKYNYKCGNFVFNKNLLFNDQYYIALKYGAPTNILKKIKNLMSTADCCHAQLQFYVFNNDINAADTILKNYNHINNINDYGLFNIACKNNNPEMVEVLLKYPFEIYRKKINLKSICQLENENLISLILQLLSADQIKKCVKVAIKNGDLFIIKKIVLLSALKPNRIQF